MDPIEANNLPVPGDVKDWRDDVTLLPDITWNDVTFYLTETPSIFTKENVRAFKSLEAYDYFVCGHVHECFYADIKGTDFCYVKSKVLPSQRQGEKAKPYEVWVCINKLQGWVLTAYCDCMAGNGKVCSHVAALLFKIQAAVQLNLRDPDAPTSLLCRWKSTKKCVEPAPLKLIDFKRIKKGDLPGETSKKVLPATHYAIRNVSAGTNPITTEDLKQLHKCNSKLALFSAIDTSEFISAELDSPRDDSDTDTSSETEENTIPDPLTSIFDPTVINMPEAELKVIARERFAEYSRSFKPEHYQTLHEITKEQSANPSWMIHRAGRITASTIGEVFSTDSYEISNKSLFDKLMQYSKPLKNKYIDHGKITEPKARKYYYDVQKYSHRNLQVKDSGFLVNATYPFLGGSTDALISCSCHPRKVLEIKCPFTYKDSMANWQQDSNFPIKEDGEMKKKHNYYFQVQLQMFLHDVQKGDFLVYCPSKPSESLLVEVEREENFLGRIMPKVECYFYEILLPELLSRKRDETTQNDRKVSCKCRRLVFGNMITCSNLSCKIKSFHYSCVGLTRKPKGKWMCPTCMKERDERLNRVADAYS